MASLFQKKIKCIHCGGNFKSRMYRKRKIYICTQADLGKCIRIPIEESFIKDLIIRRKGKLSDEEMREVLDHVVVADKWDMEVYFNEDDIPMVIKGNHNQY
jgi:hypothetical protein